MIVEVWEAVLLSCAWIYTLWLLNESYALQDRLRQVLNAELAFRRAVFTFFPHESEKILEALDKGVDRVATPNS